MQILCAERALTIVALVAFVSTSVGGQTASSTPRNGERIATAAYRLLPYDSLSAQVIKEMRFATTRVGYDSARADGRFVLEKVRYGSDGLSVVAYVYRPTPTTELRPAIVYSRGSYIADDL